jgi:hypothetical protein
MLVLKVNERDVDQHFHDFGSCTCRFEEGATQFRDDVAVNPNDTEEASRPPFHIKTSLSYVSFQES